MAIIDVIRSLKEKATSLYRRADIIARGRLPLGITPQELEDQRIQQEGGVIRPSKPRREPEANGRIAQLRESAAELYKKADVLARGRLPAGVSPTEARAIREDRPVEVSRAQEIAEAIKRRARQFREKVKEKYKRLDIKTLGYAPGFETPSEYARRYRREVERLPPRVSVKETLKEALARPIPSKIYQKYIAQPIQEIEEQQRKEYQKAVEKYGAEEAARRQRFFTTSPEGIPGGAEQLFKTKFLPFIAPETVGELGKLTGTAYAVYITPQILARAPAFVSPVVSTGIAGVEIPRAFAPTKPKEERLISGIFGGLAAVDIGVKVSQIRFTKGTQPFVKVKVPSRTGVGGFGERVPLRRRGTIIVEDPKGRVLVTYTGKQGLLPGGGVNKGETTKSAAIRELLEETGIRVNPKLVKLLGQEAPLANEVSYVYKVKLPKIPKVKAASDVTSYKWVNPKKVSYKEPTVFSPFGEKPITGRKYLRTDTSFIVDKYYNRPQLESAYLPGYAKPTIVFGKEVKGPIETMEWGKETGFFKIVPEKLLPKTKKGLLKARVFEGVILGKPAKKPIRPSEIGIYGPTSRFEFDPKGLKQFTKVPLDIASATPVPPPTSFFGKKFKVKTGVRGEPGLYFQPPITPKGPKYVGVSYLGFKKPPRVKQVKIGFEFKRRRILTGKELGPKVPKRTTEREALTFTRSAVRGREFEVLVRPGTEIKYIGKPSGVETTVLMGRRIGLPEVKIIKTLKPKDIITRGVVSRKEVKHVVFDLDRTLIDNKGNLRPGTIKLLNKLKREGKDISLWTHSKKERTDRILKQLKLEKYFKNVVTREDYAMGKSQRTFKDIKRIGGDVLIDDSSTQIKLQNKAGNIGLQVTRYKGGRSKGLEDVSKQLKELEKVREFIPREEGVVYHATKTENIKSILKEGILPPSETGKVGVTGTFVKGQDIYFTKSLKAAQVYAKKMNGKVLKVKLTKEQLKEAYTIPGFDEVGILGRVSPKQVEVYKKGIVTPKVPKTDYERGIVYVSPLEVIQPIAVRDIITGKKIKVREPTKVVKEPLRAFEEELKVSREPIKAVREPFKPLRELPKGVKEPLKAVMELPKAVKEPLKPMREPPKIISERPPMIKEPLKPFPEKPPIIFRPPRFEREARALGLARPKPTKRVQGFNAYAKVEKTKKYKKLNKVPLKEKHAKDLGSYVTDHTLSTNFKIKPTKQVPKKPVRKFPIGYYAQNKNKWRNFRIKKGVKVPMKNKWIEKKGISRLDTRGERKKLTVYKKLSDMKKKRTKVINKFFR